MKFPLAWLLFNKWLWITIFSCLAISIGPFFAIYGLLLSPEPLRPFLFFGIIIGWGVAAGYKDWVIAKHQEEKFNWQAKTTD